MATSEARQEALTELKERLRSLRAQRRFSMIVLSKRAGLSRTTISQALNGTTVPSESTVAALAAALGADAEALLRAWARTRPPAASARTPDPAELVPDGERQFEAWYRQYVGERYGQLSIIGLDLSRPERACWPLDAAYLSLELAAPIHGIGLADGRGGIDVARSGAGDGVRVERAEQALAGRHRILVRGLAGSGKTTLLQWLAVSTARRRLPAELMHLADCLPFVLPLRTLVRRGELPAPHEYLAAVGCQRAQAQPQGWVDRALLDGRTLLLVDGLDEVPETQRARTRQWLRELLSAYPQASYLVTTRPSAVPEGWLADSGFTELTVRPMSTRDVAVFVTRWHTAAAAIATTDQEREHLASMEEALKDTVRSQRDLARLTTTPLLGALVCALHRDRHGHLPHGRMALYEAALSMLLHRRDRERDIEAPEGVTLTEHQSIQLLQRLAYWLIRNGQTELDHDTARALIEDALPAMPHVSQQGDSEAVLTHLLARSGLIRQPTADTIDFVHRTFQDYLGAKAAIEGRDIPLLVRHAHDDQWEDVLRMAVAHSRPHERADLLRRLIARGDRAPKLRTRLHLLATACLEHATELDPAIRNEVEKRTAALLPPRSGEEAEALAAAGPVILDLLPGPEGLEDDEAQAVVNTAGRIGGDAALTVMKKFRTSTNKAVQSTLIAHWGNFDVDDYIREVLAHAKGIPYLGVSSYEQLAALHILTPPDVGFIGDFTAQELIRSSTLERLRAISFWSNSTLESLEFLQPFPRLTELIISDCPGVIDLSALAETSINSLGYFGSSDRGQLESLRHLVKLRHLSLDLNLPNWELRELPVAAGLRSLHLGVLACATIRTLAGINRWPLLCNLNLGGEVEGFSLISELANLNQLRLQGNADISMLEQLRPMPQMTDFSLGSWPGGSDLALIPRTFPRLETLEIYCYRELRQVDLTPLRAMRTLRSLKIRNAKEVLGAEYFPSGVIARHPRPRL
ncbi:NACHT domain-containing protein [Streptomyces sp. NPDC058301]|uniref:NACHT domain-containing protein n=1 Tax=Streptomyces sp. NPDC058301 TaxID=3346436 RepID=UPI0036EBA428